MAGSQSLNEGLVKLEKSFKNLDTKMASLEEECKKDRRKTKLRKNGHGHPNKKGKATTSRAQ